jgi:hypothetical protein
MRKVTENGIRYCVPLIGGGCDWQSLRDHEGAEKPISADCAVACAKKGSPLVILLDNGSIYWPIADTMPAEGQNERLLPFAGKRVTVTGKVYKQGGSDAIVIDKMADAK